MVVVLMIFAGSDAAGADAEPDFAAGGKGEAARGAEGVPNLSLSIYTSFP